MKVLQSFGLVKILFFNLLKVGRNYNDLQLVNYCSHRGCEALLGTVPTSYGLCMVFKKEMYDKQYHQDFLKFVVHGLDHDASSIIRAACSLLCDIVMHECGECL